MTEGSSQPERYRATGRLLFAADSGSAKSQPLHHVQVELWAKHLLSDRHVGSGATDADGWFDIAVAEGGADLKLSLRVLDTSRRYNADGSVHEEPKEVYRTTVSARSIPGQGRVLTVGELAVPFWPYRHDFPLARAADMNGRPPQEYSDGQKKLLDHYKLAYAPLYVKHRLLDPFRADARDLPAIQLDYPLSLTQKKAQESRSDAWLGDRVLNGMNLTQLGRDAEDERLYRLKYVFGDVPPDDAHDLCDVDASFKLQGDALVPVRIKLGLRTRGKWDPPQPLTFRPGDSQWEAAKRVFRVHYFLHGEIYSHIAVAHLQMEQYAIAVFRNLRLSPVRALLGPHLQEIVPANRNGDEIAWGEGSVLSWGSALGAEGLQRRVVAGVGMLDWINWRPRRPICDAHLYARAAGLFWELLTRYVDQFFAENAAAIAQHWLEIQRFSVDLVAHSPQYHRTPPDPDIIWDDRSELPATPERLAVGGQFRAVHPVASPTGPQTPQELEDLKQLCRYVLFHTTFYHSWVHDRQYEDGGEIAYASSSLRNGSLGAEDDPRIAPTPKEASFGVVTIAIGTAVRHGFILENEDRDQPPALVALLQQYKPAFDALGFDLRQVRSRINI